MNHSATIQIDVRLFAGAAELAGCRSASIRVDRGTALDAAQAALAEELPMLEPLIAVSRWAVGNDFVSESYVFREPAELAMIPPVSGG